MKTTTFPVSTSDTAITTTVFTKKVVIQEDPSVANWPTTDYKLKFPDASATAIRRPAGTSWEITCDGAGFAAGRTIGYVSTVSGTTTFSKYESGI